MQKNGIVAAAIVALVIVAGGGYYFLSGGSGGSVSGDKLREAVDQLIKELPAGVTASYKSIDGGTIRGVAVHWDDKGDVSDYTIDEVALANPNLGFAKALHDALADPKALTADTAIPLYDGVAFKGAAMHLAVKERGAVSASIGSGTAKAARVYPWAFSQPGVPSLAQLPDMYSKPASSGTLAEAMPLFRFMAAVGLGAGSDASSLENMKFSVNLPNMTGATGPQEIVYEIKKIAGGGFDRGVTKGVTAEGISVKMGSQGSATLDRVSYDGYDLRKALMKVLTAQTLTPDMLDGIKVGRIEYAGMTMQALNKPPVKIARFSISDISFSGPVPVSAGFSLQGLKISKDQMPDPQSKTAFDQLGLDTMTISMGAAYEWDLAKKSIKLHDVVVKVDELGAFNLAADVAEITPDMAGAMGAQLVHAKLTFNDASLTDRAIKAAATMQHQDPAAFRQQMTGMVQMMSAQFTANSPALAAASKAVTDFLGSPKSFSVELSPPKALPIMQLSMLAGGGVPPAQIATMVGLAVTANK
jgi:hypothetical protein